MAARVAAERGWVRPTVDGSEVLEIEDGRHPVVEALLEGGPAAATAGGSNGAPPPAAPRSGAAQGTLADRISALQGRAARVARPTAEGEPPRTAARGAPQRR